MKKEITITPVRVADLLAKDERMPVYVHVIYHPDGRVLVDTGMTELHPAVADRDPRLLPLNKQVAILIAINLHRATTAPMNSMLTDRGFKSRRGRPIINQFGSR